tara:strand:+ start:409 stop:531 length:123 start_codon:yes stop_codon:yes gene_type:complete
MKKLNSIGNVKANGKESDKIVLQIIDMSDKMLYNEFKARE